MNELGLSTPWMNLAGFGGFLPHSTSGDPISIGAFVTNPVSLLPRSPAGNRSVIEYPGGFLLHTGYPNPGLKRIIKTYAKKWEHLAIPVWVHLLVSSAYDGQEMIAQLEGLENVAAVELGLPPDLSVKNQLELIEACMGELPVLVCLPLDGIERGLVDKVAELGATGIVITAPRGVIIMEGKTIEGRLYGPGLHPQMMAVLKQLNGITVPILAGCGIFSIKQGEATLSAGAAAVQVDGWRWQF